MEATIVEMGFTQAQATGALAKCGGSLERAIMYLLENPDYKPVDVFVAQRPGGSSGSAAFFGNSSGSDTKQQTKVDFFDGPPRPSQPPLQQTNVNFFDDGPPRPSQPPSQSSVQQRQQQQQQQQQPQQQKQQKQKQEKQDKPKQEEAPQPKKDAKPKSNAASFFAMDDDEDESTQVVTATISPSAAVATPTATPTTSSKTNAKNFFSADDDASDGGTNNSALPKKTAVSFFSDDDDGSSGSKGHKGSASHDTKSTITSSTATTGTTDVMDFLFPPSQTTPTTTATTATTTVPATTTPSATLLSSSPSKSSLPKKGKSSTSSKDEHTIKKKHHHKHKKPTGTSHAKPHSSSTSTIEEEKKEEDLPPESQLPKLTDAQLATIAKICAVRIPNTISTMQEKADYLWTTINTPVPVPAASSPSSAAAPNAPMCQYFLAGYCRDGNSCRYSHQQQQQRQQQQQQQQKRVCPYYLQGYCRDGDYCQYSHSDVSLYNPSNNYWGSSGSASSSHGGGSGGGGGGAAAKSVEDIIQEQVQALDAFLKNADTESDSFVMLLAICFTISFIHTKKALEATVSANVHNERKLMALLSLTDTYDDVNRRLQRTSDRLTQKKERAKEDAKKKIAKANDPPKEEAPSYDPKNAEEFECPICMDEVAVGEGFVFQACSHPACRTCLSGYLETKIMESAVIDIPCMAPDCSLSTFSYNDIKSLVSEELFVKYEEFSLMAALKADSNFRWCPNPKSCSNAILGDPSTTKVECDACGYEFCFLCNEEWHNGTCEDYVQWKEENGKSDKEFSKWAKENSKPCPQCKARVQKNQGCNHITCANCSYQWCWLCDGKYTSNHYEIYNLMGCPGLQFEGTDDVHQYGRSLRRKAAVVVAAPTVVALGSAAVVGAAAVGAVALGGMAVTSVVGKVLRL